MRAPWMAAIVAVVGIVGAGAGRAQDRDRDEDQRLLRLSAQAESASQHARVADELIDRATALDGSTPLPAHYGLQDRGAGGMFRTAGAAIGAGVGSGPCTTT